MFNSRTLPFSPQFAGRFLLALLVLVSSLAWLPPAVQAAPQADTRPGVRLSAWMDGSQLYITALGLRRNHIYILRARRTSIDSYVRLTRVKSTRQGVVHKVVRLPSYLARADRLNVCLKDIATGRTYCTRARRRY